MNRLRIVLATVAMMALAGPALAGDRDAGTRHDPYGGYRSEARPQRQNPEYRRVSEPRQRDYEPKRLRAEPLVGSHPEYRNALREQSRDDGQPVDLLRSLDARRHDSPTEALRSRREVVVDQPRRLMVSDRPEVRVHRNPVVTTELVSGQTLQATPMLRDEPIARTLSTQQVELARHDWDSRWGDSHHRHDADHLRHRRFHRDRFDHDHFDVHFRHTTRHFGVFGHPINRYPSRVYYRYDAWPGYCHPGPVIIYPRHHHHHGWYGPSFGLSFHFKFD